MTLDSALEYHLFNDNKTYPGKVKNLSATGIMFTADQSLPLGIQVQIKLTPENDITPPMEAEVRVTRCDKRTDGHYHVAGEINKII